MGAGIVFLVIIIVCLLAWLLKGPGNSKIPRNYRMVFEYYDLGYADNKAGQPETDWSRIVEAKEGPERIKFTREIKAYKLGYKEAGGGKPKRTERMAATSAEYEQLLKELSEYLD